MVSIEGDTVTEQRSSLMICSFSVEPIYDCNTCMGRQIIGYDITIHCYTVPGSGGGGGGPGPGPGGPGPGPGEGGGSGNGCDDPGLPRGPNWGSGGGSEFEEYINGFFGEGNWVEIENPPSDLPSFDNLLDAYDYIYGNVNYGNSGQLVNVQDTNGDKRVTHYKIKFWTTLGERGVRMYVSQTRNDSQPRPSIVDITSEWYGGSFYNSWEQHENYDVESISTCSDCKKIVLYGTKITGFEWDGHGFFVETEYKIQFVINKQGIISQVYWWNID